MMLLAEADFWGVRPRIEKEIGHSSRSPISKSKTMRESSDDIPCSCPRALNCHCPRHNVCHYYASSSAAPPFLECFHCTYGPSLVTGYQGQNEDMCGANYYSHCCRSCHKNYSSPPYYGNQYHKNECNCHHVSKFHSNGEHLRGRDCCDNQMFSCCHKTPSNSIDNCCHGGPPPASTQNHHCCCCAKIVDSSCNEKIYSSCCYKTRSNLIENCCHGPAATQNRPHCCCEKFVDHSCQDIGFQEPLYSTCDHRVESSGQRCGSPRCHCH